MKLLIFTLLVLLAGQATAQNTGCVCFVISNSGGAYVPRIPGKNVTESFPYASTPIATGVAGSHVFQGSLGGHFSKLSFVGDLMNFGVISKRHAINGGFGFFQEASFDLGSYLEAGYRRVIPFHRNRFLFMPGVDLYEVLGGPIEMGQIDNKDQTLQLLGLTAAPQWYETTSTGHGNVTKTYSADQLSVIYRRDGLLMEPKIAVTTIRNGMCLGLEAGWMFQLVQSCVLLLRQEDASDDDRHNVGKIHLPRNGSMSGFYIAVTIRAVYRSRHIR